MIYFCTKYTERLKEKAGRELTPQILNVALILPKFFEEFFSYPQIYIVRISFWILVKNGKIFCPCGSDTRTHALGISTDLKRIKDLTNTPKYQVPWEEYQHRFKCSRFPRKVQSLVVISRIILVFHFNNKENIN